LDHAGRIAADQPAPLPLAYCTDVSAIPPETWPRLTGLRALVLDMLRYRHHPTHMTVDEAISAAERIGADRTWFIHMTHNILHADLDERLPDGMALGWDGLVIGGVSDE
jgi:phosphoribosyl 1,2-cyclic phosphate phosphodiesterase